MWILQLIIGDGDEGLFRRRPDMAGGHKPAMVVEIAALGLKVSAPGRRPWAMRTPQTGQNSQIFGRPLLLGAWNTAKSPVIVTSAERTLTDWPNAEADWLWHVVQWQR